MTAMTGRSGLVKIGANTVAEVTGFSVEETADLVEDTELSDTAKTFLKDIESWTATVECHADNSDSTGQEAMSIGTEVELHLLFEGATTGDIDLNGQALITGISRSAASGATNSRSFTCQGTGALAADTLV